MYPSGIVHLIEHCINKRRAQLRRKAVFRNERHYRVQLLYAFEHVVIRGIARFRLLLRRQHQLFKEYMPELLRRKDIEFLPCLLVNLVFKLQTSFGELLLELNEHFAVHAEARALHIVENRNERKLNLAVQLLHAVIPELFAEALFEETERRSSEGIEPRLLGERPKILRRVQGVQKVIGYHYIEAEVI